MKKHLFSLIAALAISVLSGQIQAGLQVTNTITQVTTSTGFTTISGEYHGWHEITSGTTAQYYIVADSNIYTSESAISNNFTTNQYTPDLMYKLRYNFSYDSAISFKVDGADDMAGVVMTDGQLYLSGQLLQPDTGTDNLYTVPVGQELVSIWAVDYTAPKKTGSVYSSDTAPLTTFTQDIYLSGYKPLEPIIEPPTVPEPATMALMASGIPLMFRKKR